MGYNTVKSVTKALAILEVLTGQMVDGRPLSLAEIAEVTGILPATARNLLRTLEECGYACRVSHGRYQEGERCHRLFRSEGILRRVTEVAGPILKRTAVDLGEGVLLVSLVRNQRLELLRCPGPNDDAKMDRPWQDEARLYRMRTTRTLLAWLTPEQLDAFLLEKGWPGSEEWPEAAEDKAALRSQLVAIRAKGGCNDIQGRYAALSVPVFATGSEAVAALGCYALLSRTDKPRAAGIFTMLRDCAEEIRRELLGG